MTRLERSQALGLPFAMEMPRCINPPFKMETNTGKSVDLVDWGRSHHRRAEKSGGMVFGKQACAAC